jgi:two-component system chemotaxis sensor kinase CheA
MSDPMQEIRASFFLECEELLEAMQDGLQLLDDGTDDPETINVVFRAVHSIKGGAGAFGLNDLVAFAHTFETALDGVRSGSLVVTDDVLKLFFQCSDTLADHVRAARDDEPLSPDSYAAILDALIELSGEEEDSDDAIAEFQPMGISLDLPDLGDADLDDLGDFGAPAPTPGWELRIAPRTELYETGNEPLYLFRALRDLGELTVRPDVSRVPDLDELEPVAAYLSWTAHLVTDEAEAAIREVFDFVEDVCDLEISEEAGPSVQLPRLDDEAPALPELAVDEAGEADPEVLGRPELAEVEPAEIEPEEPAPAAPPARAVIAEVQTADSSAE